MKEREALKEINKESETTTLGEIIKEKLDK